MLLIVFLQSCQLHKTEKIPAPIALQQKVVYDLKSIGKRFESARGKFRCKIRKPGINISFQGVFALEKDGVFKLQILDPFNNIISFLSMSMERATLITPEEEFRFGPFDSVDVIEKQWGISLAPYLVQLIFSGSYINPSIYNFEGESWLEKKDVIQLSLHNSTIPVPEKVVYDLSRGVIIERFIEDVPDIEAVKFTYFYREQERQSGKGNDKIFMIPFPESVEGRTENGDFVLNLTFTTSQYRFTKENGH